MPAARIVPFLRRGEEEGEALQALLDRIGTIPQDEGGRQLLTLSARSEAALRRLATAWAERLPDGFADLCHTARRGRERFAWRLALHAADGDEARRRLLAWDVLIGEVPAHARPVEFVSTPDPGEPWERFLDRAAAAFVAGAELDAGGFDRGAPRRVVSAPTYPFERERHWLPARVAGDAVDPAWRFELRYEPLPLPSVPHVRCAASLDAATRAAALDAMATRLAQAALAAVQPDAVAPAQQRLARRLATWVETPSGTEPPKGPEASLLRRVGAALPEILAGARDPVEALFPGGDFAAAAELYGESAFFGPPVRALATAVGAWAQARGRPLRVLELGAGTGGLTRHLLDALAPVEVDYLFTDLSPAFLAWGAARFGDRPGFATARFDLEQPSGCEGPFDLVIAANVLHATADIEASLAAVLSRVAPGGVLALVELLRAPRWVDLVFGTTQGWWRYDGDPRRPGHALLVAEGWAALLAGAGLQDISIASDGDAQGVILARRPCAPRSCRVLGRSPLARRITERLPITEPATDIVVVTEPDDLAVQIDRLAAVQDGQRAWLVGAAGPAHAALQGAFAALALERPERYASAVELADTDEPSLEALVHELASDTAEDRVRIAGAERFVARLAAAAPALPDAVPIRDDRLYLIAGGLGSLGQACAEWLAEQGAGHLLLVGRTERQVPAVERLRRRGIDVRVVALDLADATAAAARLRALIDRPLGGIVHAAGLADGPTRAVIAAKLDIARTLEDVAGGQPIDFLAAASSAAAVWGAAGQPAYAAANAALDAWAQAARQRGVPAFSLGLGRLAVRGLLTEAQDERLAAAGLRQLPMNAVVQAMLQGARGPTRHAVLAAVDWPTFIATVETRRRHRLFDRLRAPKRRDEPAAAVTPPTRAPLAPDGLCAAVAEVLGHGDPARIDPTRGLFEQGLDSLMALTLRRRLEETTGAPVPASLLFSHPTIERLTAWLERRTAAPASVATSGARSQPVAVIGIGCRFPGGIDGPDRFAEAVYAGQDLVREVPAERWSNGRWYDPDPARPGKIASRWLGTVEGVDRFDAAFFGIGPREAAQMDPQQRLLLETSWEALEDAGIAADRLAGSRTGIFVGATGSDYASLCRAAGRQALDAQALTGQPSNTLAGRLAYVLGSTGPAMVVDTACSSSMVALHLAVQALRSGEADLALAAGVNLVLAPEGSVILSKAGLMAADGRCKTFDAAADGYVRADGCGAVVLKPLDAALAAGDRVIAVIRGSAINHDGRSSSFTAPNGSAQEAVLRAALADAGLAPSDIGCIEAHGTGTALGDPVELDALAALFAGREAPLVVGSVKTNFGHAEAAAGIAGVIKAALMVGRGTIAPHLHFRSLNPHAALGTTPITVPTRATPWPVRPARCGVSAFGASGTNAHVILEEPPEIPAQAAVPSADDDPPVLLLTARTPEALLELARRHQARLAAAGAVEFRDACHTAAMGRVRHPWWAVARSADDLERVRPDDGPLPAIVVPAGRRVALPTYPFERRRHWIEVPASAGPLLQPAVVSASTGETIHGGRLDRTLSWIADHRVDGRVILPATGFLALWAATGVPELEDVEFLEPLEVPETGVSIQLVRHRDRTCELFAEGAEGWRRHGRARAATATFEEIPPLVPHETWGRTDGTAHAARLRARGFDFGPSLCRIRSLRHTADAAAAELGPAAPAEALEADPALLDQVLQAITSLLPEEGLWLPQAIGSFAWRGPAGPGALRAEVRLLEVGDGEAWGQGRLVDGSGRSRATFDRVVFRRRQGTSSAWISELVWRPAQVELRALDEGWHAVGQRPERTAVGSADERGTGPIPSGCEGVVDFRPLHASSPQECLAAAADLVRRAMALRRPPFLLFVSRGAAAAPPSLPKPAISAGILMGLIPTIRAEHPEIRCAWIDLDPTDHAVPERIVPDVERVALRAGAGYVPDLARVPQGPEGPYRLEPGPVASLERLAHVPFRPVAPGAGEVRVAVRFSGLNFKDSLAAVGRAPGGASALGYEAAGEVEEVGPGVSDLAVGDRVVVLAPGTLASHVTVSVARCARLPEGIPPAVAVTLPVAYLTAWYGLIERAQLQPGQRVLVHAGAGGVGMAALQIARLRGARAFATTGAGKASWALAAGAEATASSRDLSFVPAVQDWADGERVDVVVHALVSDTAEASARLLRPGGTFIELGSAPRPRSATAGGLRHLRYDLEEPLAADPGWFRARMAEIGALVASGKLQAPRRSLRPVEQVAESLGALAQGRTVGKLALRWPEPRFEPGRGTWLVTGGTGALGQAIADELRCRGAERVMLLARSTRPDAASDPASKAIDVSDRAALADLLADLPDLAGIVHAAGVARDATLARLTRARIEEVFAAKVEGARHLDELTRDRPGMPFILVASVVALTGSAGQAAYAAANACLVSLAQAREAAGLPATAVLLGPVQGGMFEALAPAHQAAWQRQGYRPMAPRRAAAAILDVVRRGWTMAAVMDRSAPKPGTPEQRSAGLRAVLDAAEETERRSLLEDEIVQRVQALLGFAAGTRLDPRRALRDLGLDSLLAVSLRNELATALGLDLPASLALDHPTLEQLAIHLEERLFGPVDALDGLTSAELARLLEQELEGQP